MAAHGSIAVAVFESEENEVEELVAREKLSDPESEALKRFALAVYEEKGRVSDEELKTFLDAGFTRGQALDVVANIAAKVMTNFANQIALNPVDEAYEPLTRSLPYTEEREMKVEE